MSEFLLDYPFHDRLFPGALDAVHHAATLGTPVILSDGDAVFQPRKVHLAGLWKAFHGHVLIYVHKEQMLANIEHWYPAHHYVVIDDKLAILDAIKQQWGGRVTTVFVRQGHYANDEAAAGQAPAGRPQPRVDRRADRRHGGRAHRRGAQSALISSLDGSGSGSGVRAAGPAGRGRPSRSCSSRQILSVTRPTTTGTTKTAMRKIQITDVDRQAEEAGEHVARGRAQQHEVERQAADTQRGAHRVVARSVEHVVLARGPW